MPECNIIAAFLLGAICGIVFMDIFFRDCIHNKRTIPQAG